jgi:hypothetical protein
VYNTSPGNTFGNVNDATVAPNIVKISIADNNKNRFIGFFVPTS